MAQIANIVIADGKGTPENHTYVPIKDGTDAMLRTQNAALPQVGQEVLKIQIVPVNSQIDKVVLTLELPALETATGANASGYTAAPKVGYTNRFVGSFFCPNRGTAAQRTDLRVLVKNLLANAIVVDAIDNLAPAN